MKRKIIAAILILFTMPVVLVFNVYSEEPSGQQTESVDSVSESADKVFESVESDVKPTESLEDASESIGDISEEPTGENPDVGENETQTPQEKPLGVREAEGKVIGE